MNKIKSYFIIGILLVLFGCFLFTSNISQNLGRLLLTVGFLIELFAIYKFINTTTQFIEIIVKRESKERIL